MPDNKKQSLLIIESDDAILKNLTERFKKRGMLVITAKDGYEGYTRACNESPDFIIVEVLLPSMSGFRIARLLKYDERYKDIVLVMITTNDLNAVNEMFEACGADKILRKPFRFKELMEAMNGKVAA
jgi:DNA-binding response OmpR family regulator